MENTEPNLYQQFAEACTAFTGVLYEVEKRLDELEQSPLALAVDVDLTRMDTERVRVDVEALPSNRSRIARGAKGLIEGAKEPLAKAAENADKFHDVIYNTGKGPGVKFRPWQAVKVGEQAARVAKGLAKAVPFLAAALDFYANYRGEKEEEGRQQHLAKVRLALRRAFFSQVDNEARVFRKASREFLSLLSRCPSWTLDFGLGTLH